MIDTVLNLLFRCSHRRLTRPVTPVSKAGHARRAAGGGARSIDQEQTNL